MATPFTGSYIHRYSTTNGTVSLQGASGGEPVVFSRDVGLGRVVMIAQDDPFPGSFQLWKALETAKSGWNARPSKPRSS